MTSASSINEARHSKLVLWDSPEEWSGEGGGSGFRMGGTNVYLWSIHADVWQKPSRIVK